MSPGGIARSKADQARMEVRALLDRGSEIPRSRLSEVDELAASAPPCALPPEAATFLSGETPTAIEESAQPSSGSLRRRA
jgi:hypothetical protein